MLLPLRRLTKATLTFTICLGAFVGPAQLDGSKVYAAATVGIIEGQLGYGSGGSMFGESPTGLVTRLSLGFGGKRKGWPLRFYGLLNTQFGRLSADFGTTGGGGYIERELTSITGGGRLLVPLTKHLRLFGDASIGYLTVCSRASLSGGLERHTAADSSLLIELGLGLQYRFIREISVGARAQVGIAPGLDDHDSISSLINGATASGSLAPSFLFTTTAHF